MKSRTFKAVSVQKNHCLCCVLKGVKHYDSEPGFTLKKYSRVIELFAKRQRFSLDAALDFFIIRNMPIKRRIEKVKEK